MGKVGEKNGKAGMTIGRDGMTTGRDEKTMEEGGEAMEEAIQGEMIIEEDDKVIGTTTDKSAKVKTRKRGG